MDGSEFAIIGAVGVAFAIIGGIIYRDRQLHKTVRDGDDELRRAMKEGDDQLHERVNRVRDEYVKRVDHDASMGRIDTTLQEIRQEQRDLYKTVLQVLPSRNDRSS